GVIGERGRGGDGEIGSVGRWGDREMGRLLLEIFIKNDSVYQMIAFIIVIILPVPYS
ncbi:MAG: hypothetical protein F6K56_22845, partial [Moorea sp. SIO3G5]|nr:hypothetical protein [Moorena sp. SIO3G5]